MAEELQSLLEKIQKDGIEKADAESARLVDEAKRKAESIVKEAGAKAEAMLKKAEQEEKLFVDRGRKALEQAARDTILSIGESLNKVLREIVSHEVTSALSPDVVKNVVAEAVRAYASTKGGTPTIEVLLNPSQKKTVIDHLMSKFAETMKSGVEVKGDGSIVSGFKVAIVNDKVEHDFSGDAIADAICQLLRPELAEIARKATAG